MNHKWKIGDVGIYSSFNMTERFKIICENRESFEIEVLFTTNKNPNLAFSKNSRYAIESELDYDYILDKKLELLNECE